jgi:hypothetical protein
MKEKTVCLLLSWTERLPCDGSLSKRNKLLKAL